MKSAMMYLSLSFSLVSLPAMAAYLDTSPGVAGERDEIAMQAYYLHLDIEAVSPEELARSRGGFIAPGNIQIDIGFEKILMVDGILQSQTKLSVDNLAAKQLNQLSMGMVNLIESGSDPVKADTASPLNHVLQNNLDQKLIQSIKVLDIQLKNVGNTSRGPLQQMLHSQLIGSLR